MTITPLPGLKGNNPLAFLATLGTIRSLSIQSPSRAPTLAWMQEGNWIAALHTHTHVDQADILDALEQRFTADAVNPALAWCDNINATPSQYRMLCQNSLAAASLALRHFPDYLSAFACEAVADEESADFVADTALRTMKGAGHQHFLAGMREIASRCTRQHLERTLFHDWDYADPLQGCTLRFDPSEDRRYAYQWKNPSKDTDRSKSGAMLGANRLAIEGIPLLQTVPVRSHLETVGFRGHKANNTAWTWPVWDAPLSLDAIASVLRLADLQQVEPDHTMLAAMGICAVYRSRRFTTGKYRNFSPAKAVWTADFRKTCDSWRK